MARKRESAKEYTKRLARIDKTAAVLRRPGTPGERQAAEAALKRLRATDDDITIADWTRQLEELKAASKTGAVPKRQTAPRKPPHQRSAARKPAPKSPPRAKATKPHLTDATIKRMEPPAEGNRITYDATVPGFGIRVTANGAKSFVLTYRTKAGRERRITIGSADRWQTTAARAKAKEFRRLIDDGGDPLADIEEERAAPTMAELCDRFEAEHLPKRRPGTQADYKSIIANHIKPHFGRSAKVVDVTTEDVEKLHRKITSAGHKRRANTTVAVLSKMFSLAARWKMRTDNPCKGIERHPEVKRKRYLNGDELPRLIETLNAQPNPQIANIFRLLLLTGARRGEVLGMRWADVDLTQGKWTKPGSTTKQKTEHEVPLSAPARQLLSEIAEEQTSKRGLPEYVFPGNGDKGHVVEVKRAWRHITKAAGITSLRIHDLRHSFASELVSSGASLPMIGALLGHGSVATTHRYSHLYADPLKAAVEHVGRAITAAGNPPVAPIEIKGGRRK